PQKGGAPIVVLDDLIGLTAGETVAMPTPLNIVPPYPSSDNYRLVVTVDPENKISETNETNNVVISNWFPIGVNVGGLLNLAHPIQPPAQDLRINVEGQIISYGPLPAPLFAVQYALEPQAGGVPVELLVESHVL